MKYFVLVTFLVNLIFISPAIAQSGSGPERSPAGSKEKGGGREGGNSAKDSSGQAGRSPAGARSAERNRETAGSAGKEIINMPAINVLDPVLKGPAQVGNGGTKDSKAGPASNGVGAKNGSDANANPGNSASGAPQQGSSVSQREVRAPSKQEFTGTNGGLKDRGEEKTKESTPNRAPSQSAQQKSGASFRISESTASELKELLNEQKNWSTAGNLVTGSNLIRVIFDWVSNWASQTPTDLTGDEIFAAAELVGAYNGALRTQLKGRIEELRWATQSRPREDQKALQLLFELLEYPHLFNKENIKIQGNRLYFKSLPFKDQKKSVKVNRHVASTIQAKLTDYLTQKPANSRFVYLALGSAWSKKFEATTSSSGPSNFQIDHREYMMLKTALYNLPPEETIKFAFWLKKLKEQYPDSSDLIEIFDTWGGWSDDGRHLMYWYPLYQ